MCTLLLTRVSPGTEGTLSAPGDPVQAAAFGVRRPVSLEGLRAHVVPLQALPANIHVHIVIRLERFWERERKRDSQKMKKKKQKKHDLQTINSVLSKRALLSINYGHTLCCFPATVDDFLLRDETCADYENKFPSGDNKSAPKMK